MLKSTCFGQTNDIYFWEFFPINQMFYSSKSDFFYIYSKMLPIDSIILKILPFTSEVVFFCSSTWILLFWQILVSFFLLLDKGEAHNWIMLNLILVFQNYLWVTFCLFLYNSPFNQRIIDSNKRSAN